ncbi:hypothetical protein NIES4071_36190 [Calothrix sp. NIES-4071]|nr:hypothetical protein NIES4071_36190 [Calothrix sp. NIES-4071]BAZ57938.1 hypothetical protein NIES4105_36120 [Calothrix sp. NIES-4105]
MNLHNPMSIAKDKTRVNAIVPIPMLDKVKAFADKEKRSVSQMVVILIEEAIENRESGVSQNKKINNIDE